MPHPLVIMSPMITSISSNGGPAIDSGTDLVIDCDTCVMRRTDTCRECVVSFLIERDDQKAMVFHISEVTAMRMLAHAGLVPTLRHRGCR